MSDEQSNYSTEIITILFTESTAQVQQYSPGQVLAPISAIRPEDVFSPGEDGVTCMFGEKWIVLAALLSCIFAVCITVRIRVHMS